MGHLFLFGRLRNDGIDYPILYEKVWIYGLCVGFVLQQSADGFAILFYRAEKVSGPLRFGFCWNIYVFGLSLIYNRNESAGRIVGFEAGYAYAPVGSFPGIYNKAGFAFGRTALRWEVL